MTHASHIAPASNQSRTTALSRWVCFIVPTLMALALIVASAWVSLNDLDAVVRERLTVIERAQAGTWIVALAIGAYGCIRQRRRRGAYLLLWASALAFLAGLRELDAQVLFNPENIHLLGLREHTAIHWSFGWWTDSDVPVHVRATWALALGALAALVVLPFAMAGYPWPSRLLARDPFPWLMVLAFALLGAGFLIDGADAGAMRRAGIDRVLIEELVELAGALCFAAWVAWLSFGHPDLRVPRKAGRERGTPAAGADQ